MNRNEKKRLERDQLRSQNEPGLRTITFVEGEGGKIMTVPDDGSYLENAKLLDATGKLNVILEPTFKSKGEYFTPSDMIALSQVIVFEEVLELEVASEKIVIKNEELAVYDMILGALAQGSLEVAESLGSKFFPNLLLSDLYPHIKFDIKTI